MRCSCGNDCVVCVVCVVCVCVCMSVVRCKRTIHTRFFSPFFYYATRNALCGHKRQKSHFLPVHNTLLSSVVSISVLLSPHHITTTLARALSCTLTTSSHGSRQPNASRLCAAEARHRQSLNLSTSLVMELIHVNLDLYASGPWINPASAHSFVRNALPMPLTAMIPQRML